MTEPTQREKDEFIETFCGAWRNCLETMEETEMVATIDCVSECMKQEVADRHIATGTDDEYQPICDTEYFDWDELAGMFIESAKSDLESSIYGAYIQEDTKTMHKVAGIAYKVGLMDEFIKFNIETW